MATVTISAENLQSVYSQLNFLRNYVGVWSLDWQEHVVTAAKPAAAAPAPVAPAPVTPAPVVTEVPEVVVSAPVKKSYFWFKKVDSDWVTMKATAGPSVTVQEYPQMRSVAG